MSKKYLHNVFTYYIWCAIISLGEKYGRQFDEKGYRNNLREFTLVERYVKYYPAEAGRANRDIQAGHYQL